MNKLKKGHRDWSMSWMPQEHDKGVESWFVIALDGLDGSPSSPDWQGNAEVFQICQVFGNCVCICVCVFVCE